MDWSSIEGCIEKVNSQGKIVEVPTLNCVPALFQNIVNAALIFAGIAAVIFIIISGIKLITSSGDAKKLEGARSTLTYAIIGLLLILLSFFIISFIGKATGVECIQLFGFNSCK